MSFSDDAAVAFTRIATPDASTLPHLRPTAGRRGALETYFRWRRHSWFGSASPQVQPCNSAPFSFEP